MTIEVPADKWSSKFTKTIPYTRTEISVTMTEENAFQQDKALVLFRFFGLLFEAVLMNPGKDVNLAWFHLIDLASTLPMDKQAAIVESVENLMKSGDTAGESS